MLGSLAVAEMPERQCITRLTCPKTLLSYTREVTVICGKLFAAVLRREAMYTATRLAAKLLSARLWSSDLGLRACKRLSSVTPKRVVVAD